MTWAYDECQEDCCASARVMFGRSQAVQVVAVAVAYQVSVTDHRICEENRVLALTSKVLLDPYTRTVKQGHGAYNLSV